MKILTTFKIPTTIHLDESQIREALRLLNQHYLGVDDCNHIVDGRLVAKFPDRETPELKESHHNIRRSVRISLPFNLMEDGSLVMVKGIPN